MFRTFTFPTMSLWWQECHWFARHSVQKWDTQSLTCAFLNSFRDNLLPVLLLCPYFPGYGAAGECGQSPCDISFFDIFTEIFFCWFQWSCLTGRWRLLLAQHVVSTEKADHMISLWKIPNNGCCTCWYFLPDCNFLSISSECERYMKCSQRIWTNKNCIWLDIYFLFRDKYIILHHDHDYHDHDDDHDDNDENEDDNGDDNDDDECCLMCTLWALSTAPAQLLRTQVCNQSKTICTEWQRRSL